MAYLKKNIKSSKRKDQEKIAVIVQHVKNFEFKKISNVAQAKNISDGITEEWLRLSSWYAQKIDHKKINPPLAAEHEAQQQIIFCLMSLLNEKILGFFNSYNKKKFSLPC